MMVRREGWESRLMAVVEDARSRPYQLGDHDCLRFTCACIESLTGEDLWPRFKGYHTHREAYRAIKAIAPSLAEAVSVVLEKTPVKKVLARRGDVVLYRDVEDHLGVCVGAQVAVLGPEGLAFASLSDPGVLFAWGVG